MTQLQLARKKALDGVQTLVAVPNPLARPYREVLGSDERAVLMGSDDLLRFSIRLGSVGFSIASLTLSDLAYGPAGEDVDMDRIVNLLRNVEEGSVADFARAYLPGLIVLAVTLQRKSPAMSQIRVTQNGSLSAPESAVDQIMTDIRQVIGDS